MFEIVRLVRAVCELLLSLGQPLVSLLVQPMVTVILLLFLYAGWHVRDEGDILTGLQVAFVDTRAYRAEHARELEAAMLQAELRQAAHTDRLIGQLLSALLTRAPLAARVRLAVVHNGLTGVTGVALLRFDIVNATAAAGHSVGTFVVNQPLSDWSDFLPGLVSGRCQHRMTSSGSNLSMRARLDSLGAGGFLACPVVDIQDRMLGALFITWDTTDPPPSGEAMAALSDYAISIGTQVASALDLRGRLSPLSGLGGNAALGGSE
ncbi:MAG: hypothetical protein WDN25_10940 [Acetobacteraceae bacterium]